MKHLRIPPLMATAAVALSLVLGGCGSSSNTMDEPDPPPPPPPPMPVDVSMTLNLSPLAQYRLAKVRGLEDAGDSTTVMIPAGETVNRAAVPGNNGHSGVDFSCESMYPCTVTIMNSAGTITATWESMMLPDGDAPMVMASAPVPLDPLAVPAVLNAAYPSSVSAILGNPVEDSTSVPPASPHGNASTTVGGLGLDEGGADDMSGLSLTSDLDPTTTTAHTPRVVSITDGSVTTPAAGGSTMTYKDDMIPTPKVKGVNDETGWIYVDPNDPNKTRQFSGWAHNKVLFRDWGDTGGTGDGGFETGALVYSNMEGSAMKPFNDELASMFANPYVQAWFALNPDGAVEISSDVDMGWTTPLKTISIKVEGSQAASVQINVRAVEVTDIAKANEYKGTYFGASGTFACVGTANCVIERGKTDDTDFGVADTNSAEDGLQPQGNWRFTPDMGEEVAVPDQDWIVFGAWLTTPDDTMNGSHRLGVFHDGMRTYAYDTSAAPKGSAKYNGSATGVYMSMPDGAAGLFTARVMLDANYDVAGTDHRLSGQIDDFKDTRGFYLGSDTAADPNDLDDGGENDWFVILNASPIAADGVVDGTGGIGGAADGVNWGTGEWSAQLYGRVAKKDGTRIKAEAVAGQFRAQSGSGGSNRAVVGAFGAEE